MTYQSSIFNLPSSIALLLFVCSLSFSQEQLPALEFPAAGLDDSAAYRDYRTRFYRDSGGNAVQVVLNDALARTVNLWADAANESISFTVKDTTGRPLPMMWVSPGATPSSEGTRRYLEYTLTAAAPGFNIGQLILGSMRKERDFQYDKRSLLPLDSLPPVEPELTGLLASLNRLSADQQQFEVGLLLARSLDELRSRLRPRVEVSTEGRQWAINAVQPTFDGRNLLSLQLRGDTAFSHAALRGDSILVRSTTSRPVVLTLRIGTSSPPLTPLYRDQIFNPAFHRFYDRLKAGTSDSARHAFRQLEREVRSIEMLSSRQKLMAGLPNFATYFGRDMMMSAMMLEPVLQPSVLEDVIAAVLLKLSPEGKVSHEESLGGQAIRENAARASRHLAEYFHAPGGTGSPEAARILKATSDILADLQSVREDYKMVDETFQLPVIAARYLTRSDVPAERKRRFLLAPAELASAATAQPQRADTDHLTRLALLMRNLQYIARITAPFSARQTALNLVGFPRLPDGRWLSGSWRDSGPGYANGRFAMDINAIWAPAALEAIRSIGRQLRLLNVPASVSPVRNPDSLAASIRAWKRAGDYFVVKLDPGAVRQRVKARLSRLPAPEQEFWAGLAAARSAADSSVTFLALSLDSLGHPIPVMNTDPATWLFLSSGTAASVPGAGAGERLESIVRTFVTPYPVGLFAPRVGPLVANDAYASPSVWEAFEHDQYHSPRVIWGREVNLFLLGLSAIIKGGKEPGASRQSLLAALHQVNAAVDSSGLKHNELWSYAVTDGSLVSARYPASCDIQLWNLTDLAVAFKLAIGN